MPAELSIDGCLVVHRREAHGKTPGYRESADGHDACVWIRDSRAGSMDNLWHCYYADEVILLLRDLATIDFSPNVVEDRVGAVVYRREHVHGVTFQGKTDAQVEDHHYALDWEISLGAHWETFPYEEAMRQIERARVHVEPGQMWPIHPSQAWPGDKLLRYFELWQDRPNKPPHLLLPISITR